MTKEGSYHKSVIILLGIEVSSTMSWTSTAIAFFVKALANILAVSFTALTQLTDVRPAFKNSSLVTPLK